MNVYFVTWFLHNKINGGWAYKVLNKYTSIDAALKAYYSELSQYIGGETYDCVTVMLTDYAGNILQKENWIAAEEPEPEPEPNNE